MVQSIGSGVVGHWMRKRKTPRRVSIYLSALFGCVCWSRHASRNGHPVLFQGHDRTLGPQPRDGTRLATYEGVYSVFSKELLVLILIHKHTDV
jgi:hypothetical protein